MNRYNDTPGDQNILSGKWKQLKGKVKEEWGDLTDDDLTMIDGKREQLAGKLEERYGWDRNRANSEIEKFLARHREI